MNKFAPLEYTQPLRPEAMDHEPSTKPCGHNVSTVTPNAQLDLLADPNCCKPLGHTGRQANIYEVSGHYAYTSIRLCCHGALDNSTRFVFIRVYGAMYAIFHKQCRRTDIGLCTLKMHCGWHKSFQAKMNDSSTFIIVENLTSKSLLHIFWWAKKKRWPVIIKVDIHTQICQSMKWNYSKRRGSGRNENGYFERIPLYDNFPRETFARHKIAAFFVLSSSSISVRPVPKLEYLQHIRCTHYTMYVERDSLKVTVRLSKLYVARKRWHMRCCCRRDCWHRVPCHHGSIRQWHAKRRSEHTAQKKNE